MLLRNVLIMFALAAGCATAQYTSFTTIENQSDMYGLCGSPGHRECASTLTCGQAPGLSLRFDPYTGFLLCDLPTASCPAFLKPVQGANTDVTFLVITDTHLRNGWSITDSEHTMHTHVLNGLPSMGFNWSQAGAGFDNKPIGTPLAAVITGDETDDGLQTHLGAYRLLYEQNNSTDSLHYYTFPGLGNHDVQNQCEFFNCSRRMFDYVAAASCGANVDGVSHNYSWDWGQFHLIQLNVWAGSTQEGTDSPGDVLTHGSGLNWLISDLQNNVGTSGRPVILFQHFGWDFYSVYNRDFTGMTPPWWTVAERQQLLDIIAPYNVIGLFSGHQHDTGMYSASYFTPSGNSGTLDDFTGGAGGIGGFGQFFTVRLTNNFLDVLPFEWSQNSGQTYMTGVGEGVNGSIWSNQGWIGSGDTFNPLPGGTPAYPTFFNNVNGCRKWIGQPPRTVPLTITSTGSSVTIANNTGSTINGPFALQMNSLPSEVAVTSVSFMGTCAKGPVYQEFNATSLTPGGADRITVTTTGSASGSLLSVPNLSVVTMGSDSFVISQSLVTVTAASPATVNLSTAFGKSIGFTYPQNITGGLKVSVNSNQTPAVMTFSIDTGAAAIGKIWSLQIAPAAAGYSPATITIELGTTPVTIMSNNGDLIGADGKSYASPHVFNWYPLDTHTISVTTQQVGAGIQDRFVSWSAEQASVTGGLQQQNITAPFYPASYTAAFQRYYLVSPTVAPSAVNGTVTITPSSPDGYYAAGTPVSVLAAPNKGFAFIAFSHPSVGTLPSGNPFGIKVTGPLSFTAQFAPTGTYTVGTGLGAAGTETVDNNVHTGPVSLTWASGTSHTLSVPAEIDPAPGVRQVFTGWSDGIATAMRTVDAGATTSYIANYQLQYLVSTAVSPASGGALTGGGWYNNNATAALTATPASGYSFSGFSGDASGTPDPLTLTISKAENVIANFQPGTPSLYASAGPRNDSDPTVSNFTFNLTNTGMGAAVNAEIDSVTAIAVSGSGAITPSGFPLAFGTIAPGMSASAQISFNWPAAAVRAGFTVHFSANNRAYSGTTTFYVFR